MKLIINTDGGARENPGPAGAGVVIVDEAGRTLHKAGYWLGKATNNEAEYRALIRGLELAREMGASSVRVRCDSQLIVEQTNGRWKVKEARLQPLCERARSLLLGFGPGELTWVRREQNAEADRLYNLAMDREKDVILVANGAEQAPPAGDAGGAADGEPPALPCFSATLKGKARQCLAGIAPGNEYTFGPTTPEGFCVHAAAAALGDEGPLAWRAGKRLGEVRCRACRQAVALNRLA